MKTQSKIFAALGALVLASCAGETRPNLPDGEEGETQEEGASMAKGPKEQAALFRRAIEEAAAAVDFAAAVGGIRKMDEYMVCLSEAESEDFASHWTDPSMGEWLQQLTETLQRDVQQRMREGLPVTQPPPYGDHAKPDCPEGH